MITFYKGKSDCFKNSHCVLEILELEKLGLFTFIFEFLLLLQAY